MKLGNIILLVLISASITGVIAIPYIFHHDAYAHNFNPNSLSTFLSQSLIADVELSLAESNFPSNVTLALDHSEKALNLVNDTYYFDDDIVYDMDFYRKYTEVLNSQNATIHALVVANIVDQILKEYGESFEVGYDLTNMSNMNVAIRNLSSFSSLSPTSMSKYSDTSTEESQNYTRIVNLDNYQSSQKLSEIVCLFFKDKLLNLSNYASNDEVEIIEKNLFDLKDLINSRASAEIIMTLVHMKIHPNLQAAYGLEIREGS